MKNNTNTFMKRTNKHLIMIALCGVIFLSNISFSQTWRKVVEGENHYIYGLYFINSSTGFWSGDSNIIKKTTDGGNTWVTKCKIPFIATSAGSIRYLRSIFFANENIGYCGGDEGLFVKTTDGGETWNKITISSVPGTINSVYFNNENEGYITAKLSSGYGILRTTDGGSSWTQVLSSTTVLNELKFYGTSGIVMSNSVSNLYYTTDGINWTKSATPATGGITYVVTTMYSVYMIDAQTAFAVGFGTASSLNPGIILKTTDGGATWNYIAQTPGKIVYDSFHSVWFKDQLNGLAIGGSLHGSDVLKTTDGGQNWTPYPVPCGGTLNIMYAVGDEVWIGGNYGIILHSTDFGSTWEIKNKMPGGNMYAIKAIGNTIITGGIAGISYKSTNSGKDWSAKYLTTDNASATIEDIFFLNENVGYIARDFRQVCKTTDGGETWNSILPDTISGSVASYSVYFVNESLGFVVGKIANNVDVIYKTTDGGSTWAITSNMIQANLRSVAFANNNAGAIVAEGLRGLYTTDGGNTWNTSTFNSVPESHASDNLKKVTFSDGLNAIAVGDSIILKSTDGGANWNFVTVNGLQEKLFSVIFKNANEGYALGCNAASPYTAAIYSTTDGGSGWTNTAPDSGIVKPSSAIAAITLDKDGYLWITGPATYTTALISGVNKTADNLSGSFELKQNYPNPFNPSTVISYSVPKESRITLRVYDILGREVSTLVNADQKAGSYKIMFNASNLASGIYFYSLKANGYQTAKKMLLIK